MDWASLMEKLQHLGCSASLLCTAARGKGGYYIQIHREWGLLYTVQQETGLAKHSGSSLWREQSSGCEHPGEKAIVHTLSAFALEWEEGFAIPLNLTWGRLCHSVDLRHGFDMAVSTLITLTPNYTCFLQQGLALTQSSLTDLV